MKKRKILAALTALCCTTGMMTSFPIQNALAADGNYTICNPIIYSDVPDDDIIRVGDTYYMVSTTMFFSPGAPIMKSKDLFSWEICNYVYDTLSDGPKQTLSNGEHDYAHGSWAASLRYHDGFFYVFFGSYGTGKSYIYKTKDIENGPWTCSTLNGMYHDASMFFDDDGRNYLVYGGGGEIKIKEFNSEMTDFKWGGLDKTLFKTGLTGLAGEGSHIQKINGTYYVFVIAWPNGHPRIELCYRSSKIDGNYEGKTILESGLGTYGSGVAQGGIVDTPDGQWYGLMFQDHGAVGRIPVLVPVTWQDGWPMLGVNGKAPVTLDISGSYAGTFLAKDDDFTYDSNKLMLEWQWNHNPDNKAWSVTERPGFLRLHNEHTATNILNARNTLTMRTEGPSCSSVIKLDTSGMKAGDYAGLSAFQFNYGNVGVYLDGGGGRHVYMAKNGGSEIANSSNKIIAEKPMDGKEIYLKVDFTFATVDGNHNISNNIDRANFFYSYDGNNWTQIGDTLGMTYDLKLFTGYRSGIYSYATKETGGYADIDFFDYERAEWNPPIIVEPDKDGYWFHYTFENGNEGFTGRGSAKVSTTTDEAYAGNKSLACTGREAAWNGAAHSLNSGIFKAGEEYSFSAIVRYNEGAETEKFYFTIQYTGSDNEVYYDKIATESTTAGEWLQLANQNYKIPEGASNMVIYIETDESKIDFFVDEMIGAPAGTAIDGPTPPVPPTPITPGDLNFDDRVNAVDLSLLKLGLIEGFGDKDMERAGNFNNDKSTDIADAVALTRFLTEGIFEVIDG